MEKKKINNQFDREMFNFIYFKFNILSLYSKYQILFGLGFRRYGRRT